LKRGSEGSHEKFWSFDAIFNYFGREGVRAFVIHIEICVALKTNANFYRFSIYRYHLSNGYNASRMYYVLNINCFKAILWRFRAESVQQWKTILRSPFPSQSTSAIQLKFDTIAIPFHISSSEIDTGYNSSKFNSPDVADTEK